MSPWSSVVFLPLLLNFGKPLHTPYPNPDLVERYWQAAAQFAVTYPPADLFPGYARTADGSAPTRADAHANIEAACHDFPDLKDNFGTGAHHRACYDWAAVYLASYHAARVHHAPDRAAAWNDLVWMQYYLDEDLDVLEEFVYGPQDSPGGGYRDTLAAVWQNPLRANSLVIVADLLRRNDALGAEREARVMEVLSAIARAWYAEFWLTGVQPSTGVSLTTRAAMDGTAFSLAGRQVVSEYHHTVSWDADVENTPAEELAWMGAGVLLATRVAGERLTDGPELAEAGRHYVDFALTYDRPDPLHGNALMRTLNAKTTGGAYGQRRYWIQNHAPATPAIPYVGSVWHFLGMALIASPLGGQTAWPDLVPDDAQWQVMLASAGETLRGPDGTFLVDFTPGSGIGFNLARFPAWWMPCKSPMPGRMYVYYDGRFGGPSMFLSEIGLPAGMELVSTWPILRLAAQRHDQATYDTWLDRLTRILDEYRTRPPNLAATRCQVTGYSSDNPAYYWSRIEASLATAYLGADGYSVEPWSN